MSLPVARQTQRQRRAQTRAALIAAAAELFADLGYDAVSVDAVAELAGRTSGAVYDHFGSKQGLLLAVLDDWSQTTVSALVSAFQGTETLRQRLHALATTMIVEPSDGTQRMLLLEHELSLRAARDPVVATAVRRRGARMRQRLVRGLASWKEEGVLPDSSAPAEDLAATVAALVMGMEMQQRIEPGSFDADSAAGVLEAALTSGADPPGP